MSGLRCIEDKDRWSLHESFVLVTNKWKTGRGILCTRGKKKAGCATGTERDRKRLTLSRAFSLRFLDSSTCVFHAFFRLFHVRFSWVFWDSSTCVTAMIPSCTPATDTVTDSCILSFCLLTHFTFAQIIYLLGCRMRSSSIAHSRKQIAFAQMDCWLTCILWIENNFWLLRTSYFSSCHLFYFKTLSGL